MKKIISLLLLCTMFASANAYDTCGAGCYQQQPCCEPVSYDCCCQPAGYGYSDCCRVSSICPEIAVGVVVIAATVAIILHNRSSSSHSH